MQHSTVENISWGPVGSSLPSTRLRNLQTSAYLAALGPEKLRNVNQRSQVVLREPWQRRSVGGEGLERRRVPHGGDDVEEKLFPALHPGSRDQGGWHPYLLSRTHFY